MTNVLVLMLQRNHRLAWFWHSWKHTGKSRIEFKCPTYRSKSFWSTGHNIIRRNLVAVTKTKPRKTTKKKPNNQTNKKTCLDLSELLSRDEAYFTRHKASDCCLNTFRSLWFSKETSENWIFCLFLLHCFLLLLLLCIFLFIISSSSKAENLNWLHWN